jgi:Gpi18-like mannosyltransferase
VLSWLSQTVLEMFSWIPSWLYEEGTPRFLIIRGMLGLGLIVLIMLALILRPDRVAVDCYRRYRSSRAKEPGS